MKTSQRHPVRKDRNRRNQQGFTLIEAMIATFVLIVGLAAISNLMVVAVSSNSLGSRITTASFVASEKMEQLRSIPFDNANLADSDASSLDADVGATFEDVDVPQGGRYHLRWNVRTVTAYGTSLKYIVVRAESTAAMGRLTRAEFTTFRACTLMGCTP